jgi:hypothetical protein
VQLDLPILVVHDKFIIVLHSFALKRFLDVSGRPGRALVAKNQ